jgi:hypothetical protein
MKLVLPPTVAVLCPDEAPGIDPAGGQNAVERIEEGFVLVHPDGPDRWTYFAKVNVDAHKLWDTFEVLAATLPDHVGAIAGFSNEEPELLPYANRTDIMSVLRLFKKELSLDAFLEFGITAQTRTEIEEVWLCGEKYFKVWGRDEASFRAVMDKLGLREVPELRFVDEFPHSHTTLSHLDTSALHAAEVLDEIVERLRALDV